jgi:AcrR family transcriptional regulator
MVDAAVVLLARGGYQATSFTTVLEASGAPRGSIYHHFPAGKDQLIAAAVGVAGARAVALLDSLIGESPVAVTDGFLRMWRSLLSATDFGVGCSVAAVTVSAPSSELTDASGTVFRAWRVRLGELFIAGGVAPAAADGFAALLIAASEGAVILARATRSLEPFDAVAGQLRGAAGILPS